MENLETVDR